MLNTHHSVPIKPSTPHLVSTPGPIHPSAFSHLESISHRQAHGVVAHWVVPVVRVLVSVHVVVSHVGIMGPLMLLGVRGMGRPVMEGQAVDGGLVWGLITKQLVEFEDGGIDRWVFMNQDGSGLDELIELIIIIGGF